jgi:hypothetical protein
MIYRGNHIARKLMAGTAVALVASLGTPQQGTATTISSVANITTSGVNPTNEVGVNYQMGVVLAPSK